MRITKEEIKIIHDLIIESIPCNEKGYFCKLDKSQDGINFILKNNECAFNGLLLSKILTLQKGKQWLFYVSCQNNKPYLRCF